MSSQTDDPVVVVTRRWPAEVEEQLRRRFPAVRLNQDDRPLGPQGLRQALRNADVVLPTVTDPLSADLFEGGVRCRFLGNYGVGYNHIDVAAAAAAGVTVTNTPGVLTDATADLAITLMLMVARRAGEGEREVRRADWTGWRPTHLVGTHLTGRTLGIVGMGRIGTAVARRAHFGFAMPVVYVDEFAEVDWARRVDTIDEVLETADVVSLHVPGGGTNTHLIDAARLARMKPGAILVNTARGDVVDTAALVAACASGALAGAGLDVYEREPDVPEDLRKLDNVVLLPHLGSATRETRIGMGMLVLENLEAFLEGREPPNRIA
ncbi:MAG: D-glycerate dehydrogenase [Pseudonocardia sp.]|nr:D-glycerate dehydrogenase [Pseudonocardia sp.]